jgi:3-deoxy-D-manno-octulosonic acid (KDO) 8-phosphate synthase
MDKIQYKIIKKIKNTYKNCEIKKVIFLSPAEKKIITKPQEITTKFKVILDCK